MEGLDVRIEVDNGTTHAAILKSPSGLVLPMCLDDAGSSIRRVFDGGADAPSQFCACRFCDDTCALLPFESFDALSTDLTEYVGLVAGNLCTHVAFISVGAHHELGCTNVEETLGNTTAGVDDVFVAEEQLLSAASLCNSLPEKLRTLLLDAHRHSLDEQIKTGTRFYEFVEAVGVDRNTIGTFAIDPLDILDHADEECTIGWAAGSLGRRGRSMNRVPAVTSDDLARIEQDIAAAAEKISSVFPDTTAERASVAIDHFRRAPSDLAAVAGEGEKDSWENAKYIAIAGCDKIHNTATQIQDLMTSMMSLLGAEAGTRAHGIAAVASSFVLSVCEAASSNLTGNLRAALRDAPSVDSFGWALEQLCRASGDYAQDSLMHRRIARLSACVAARVIFDVARTFVDFCSWPIITTADGFAQAHEGITTIGNVREALEHILSTYTVDPSNIHLLGYMPVEPPSGVDAEAYARARDAAYADEGAFPHAPLFSQRLRDIDAIVGAASADGLVKRAYYTKALAALPSGWSLLLGPSAFSLDNSLPLFAIYQEKALLSSHIDETLVPPASSYMWLYSDLVAASWGFDDVFLRQTRLGISSNLVVSTDNTCPVSSLPLRGDRSSSASFSVLSDKARSMFDAGVVPTTMSPPDSDGRTCVVPYAMWPVVEAVEDARVSSDDKARGFLSLCHSKRLFYSLGGAHCIDKNNTTGNFLLSNAVFTFHTADVKFRMAQTLLHLDPAEAAAYIVEAVDDIVSLLIARLVVSVFVGFSLSCSDGKVPVGTCYALDDATVQQTLDSIGDPGCKVLQDAAEMCASSAALVPYAHGSSPTPGSMELAAFFLSPEGIDTSFMTKTAPGAMSMDLDTILCVAQSLVDQVAAEKYLGHFGHPWANVWSSISALGPVVRPGLLGIARNEVHTSMYAASIKHMRSTLYLSHDGELSGPIELPVGFRGGWTSQLLCEFLRSLDRRQHLGFLGEWVLSGVAMKCKVLDAGESREVITGVWEALLKHAVLVNNDDGTVHFCDSAWPHVCDECDLPVGCAVIDNNCMQGIGKLVLLSQSLMTFPHNRVNFRSRTAQFSLPFRLDRGQAFMLFSSMFTVHAKDAIGDRRLNRSTPRLTGVFHDMYAYGTRRAAVPGPWEIITTRNELDRVLCTCLSGVPTEGCWDLAADFEACLTTRCAFHVPATPSMSIISWLSTRSAEDTPFEAVLRSTRVPGSHSVVFAEWYNDFFTHPVRNINDYLISRLKFSIDNDIPEPVRKMNLLCIKKLMRVWIKSLSPEGVALFLRNCTAQAYLQPSAKIYVHVSKDTDEALETAEQRNQTVGYLTCLNQVTVPSSLVETLMSSLDTTLGSPDKLKTNMDLAFL